MAGGIKGITVKIGGDTTELGRSLTSAQKQSTALQRELKGVEKLLKYDPSNVTLLKQKQELLTKAVDETKKKLEQLKEVQRKVDSGEIEMTEEEYRNLQREIASTESKLKQLEKTQADFGSVATQQISAYGEKLKSTGAKVEAVGKAFMPVTAIVGGLGAMAIKTTAEFDASMSKVSAISGATGNDLADLRAKAREMGEQTKFSASESADAMSYMAMAGWKTKDMLNGIKGVMNLASASGEDLAKTSDILTDGLTAFGLSAKESSRMADVMASASANANTNVSLLGESYKYCASTAGAMGYSLEDVTESLALMANAGVKGSQAGTTLKNAMINLAKPTAQMQGVMDKYNISLTNTDGSMKSWNDVVGNLRESLGGLSEAEKTSAIATLFGKEATAGMLALINSAPEDIEKLNNAINNSTGSAKEMADTMNDNLTGQITILKSQLQELAISFGELLVPVIRKVVSVIQSLVDKLNGMSDGQRKIILIIGAILGAVAPLLMIIGKLMFSIGSIMTYAPMLAGFGTKVVSIATKIGGALKGLFAILMANPIALVVVGITALVAGLIYAYNHCEKFRDIVNNAFASVKEFVGNAVESIASFFTEKLPNAIQSTIQWFSELPSRIINALISLPSTVANIWENVKTACTEKVRTMITTVVQFFSELPYKLGFALGTVIANIIIWVTKMYTTVTSKVPQVISAVVKFFSQLPSKLWTHLTNVIVKIGTWVSQMKTKASEGAKGFLKNAVNGIKSLPAKIWSTLTRAIAKAIAFVGKFASKGLEASKKFVTNVVNGLKGLPGKVVSVGSNIVQGLWRGISAGAGWIKEKVASFARGILDAMKAKLGIHSPSRVFEDEVGVNIVKGIIKGVNKEKKNAKKNAEELSKLYITSANNKLRQLKKANKISIAQEEDYWKKVAKECKKGSTGYKDALANATKARNDFNKQLTKLDDDYAKNVSEIKDKLMQDIQDVTDKYNKAIEDRQNSITSSLSLFEAFKPDEGIGASELTENLKSQVDALDEWNNILIDLENRKGMDSNLLKELENVGVKSLETLKALNSMSDDELDNYVSLYKEKNRIALERAEIENKALKEQSEKEIQELVSIADKSLAELEATYVKDLKKLGVVTVQQSQGIGIDIVEGLKAGIISQNASFQRFLSGFFQQIIDSAKASLDIHSPSRVFRDVIGKNIASGIAVGIKENTDEVYDAMSDLSNEAIRGANLDGLNGASINRKLSATFKADNGVVTSLNDVMNTIKSYGDKLVSASNKAIVLDSGTLVGETIDKIDSALANNQILKARGV